MSANSDRMQCVQYDFFSPNYGLYDGWGTCRTVQYLNAAQQIYRQR